MSQKLLVAVHCYEGDRPQVEMLMPVFLHHNAPIVILSPEDSPVHNIGPHITRCAGFREYYGQKSWDRQHAQLKLLLDYTEIDWFLLNDADSFCLTPELPGYLFEDKNTVHSNQVNDFRVPGQVTMGQLWPEDYHKGFPLIAMQPPYFLSREALVKIVAASEGLRACPTTPFIDWWWVPACTLAGLTHLPFRTGASCETETDNGRAVMAQCVGERSATFIHSVKRKDSFDNIVLLYKQIHK